VTLEIRDIHKDYDQKPLLRGVSFTVGFGSTFCLLGPSGSGKSTLLRIIAGLETPESGEILWDGQDLAEVPVHQRHFGLMFQEYALFPHLTVEQNAAFGLRMQNLPTEEVKTRTRSALEQVKMLDFAERKVIDLSGGEQQRVALARTLAPRPRLIMLDEPLGALDRTLREELTRELRDLLKASGIPAIYVTHDQEEAFAIADQLLLLYEGLVVQAGPPGEVYRHPANAWAARFLGRNNLLEGRVNSKQPLQVATALGSMEVAPSTGQKFEAGEPVTLLILAESACLMEDDTHTQRIHGRVEDAVFRGKDYRIRLICAEGIRLEFDLAEAHPPGSELTLFVSPVSIQCLQ
jgi:ABC-type Fe3+/spermidine/putrescine transport system ATPase subunit